MENLNLENTTELEAVETTAEVVDFETKESK